ncbi:MAG TPA: D-alanyl-D-alanine carboxypeptidase family protein [Novosphingobium sp.]|nr:D-alanyl-D-alanine carboxypeptidase family protein [Novosphingobium sp.]
MLAFAAASARALSPPAPTPSPPAADQVPVALLVDLSSGQTLFARDPDAPFLPASMTKAMTALVAFDLIAQGRLKENAIVTVRPETAARWAGKGTTLWLQPGEQVAVSDLLHGIVTASANDAAVALAESALGSEAAWLSAMNARAKALGLTGSHFASANGLPDGGQTKVTARDMVRLGEALITEHPALYRRYFGHKEMAWKGQRLASRNPLAGLVPGADGIKTGHTREAGYTFLGAAERDGRRLVLVVGKVPSEAGRAAAARDLVEWGYGAWDSRPLLSPGWVVGAVKVQDGAAREVPVTVPRGFSLAVPKGTRPRIQGTIVYQGPVRAPVAKGAPIATLEIMIEGQPVYRLPLIAAQPVSKAGPIDRIINALLGLTQ